MKIFRLLIDFPLPFLSIVIKVKEAVKVSHLLTSSVQ